MILIKKKMLFLGNKSIDPLNRQLMSILGFKVLKIVDIFSITFKRALKLL
jgi:hypothetical protein